MCMHVPQVASAGNSDGGGIVIDSRDVGSNPVWEEMDKADRLYQVALAYRILIVQLQCGYTHRRVNRQ